MLDNRLYALEFIEIRYDKKGKTWLVEFNNASYFYIDEVLEFKTQKEAIEKAKQVPKKVPIYVYKRDNNLKEILVRI